jgi:hypothetical protein
MRRRPAVETETKQSDAKLEHFQRAVMQTHVVEPGLSQLQGI